MTRVSLRALVTQPENINMQFSRSELLSNITVDVKQCKRAAFDKLWINCLDWALSLTEAIPMAVIICRFLL